VALVVNMELQQIAGGELTMLPAIDLDAFLFRRAAFDASVLAVLADQSRALALLCVFGRIQVLLEHVL
jgi:hypothetical protein